MKDKSKIMKISLTQGKVALVDGADFESVSQYKWCAYTNGYTFYSVRRVSKNRTISMHRFILGISDPKIFVDHKDGNGLNNTRENIRICTASQNQANRSKYRKSSSKYVGVFRRDTKNAIRWSAKIEKNNKPYSLGVYENQELAALAYNKAAVELHGEFARLNVIHQ